MPLPMAQQQLPGIARVRYPIAIASGKGGVGKSCVTLHLAFALSLLGYRVGLLDIDLYGPSIRTMLPEQEPPQQKREGVIPAKAHGISFLSAAFFQEASASMAIRAPIANRLIQQFFHQTMWGELDYLLIDCPPGTGDIALTLTQTIPLYGAILVTTPQEIALIDVRKTLSFFQKVDVSILGVIENMSYFGKKEKIYPFGQGGGRQFAQANALPFLGEIPLDPLLCQLGDRGENLFFSSIPEAASSLAAQNFLNCAEALAPPFLKERATPLLSLSFRDHPHSLTIDMPNKQISIPATTLQQFCACAACSQTPPQPQNDVSIRDVIPVGKYGVRFLFSSGCSSGIYSYSFLQHFPEKGSCCAC